MVDQYTQFKSVYNINQNLFGNQLKRNMKSFLDWCLLGIGGFINVNMPQSGVFGGTNFDVLHCVNDTAFIEGQVWETIRKDWVWESGVEYSGTQPIAISGVYINSNFYQPNDPTYGHYFDYPDGRVVFDSAIPTSSVVQMNYSYRYVQTYIVDDIPNWRAIQYRSFRTDDLQWNQNVIGSGDWFLDPQHRIQLPAIVVETPSRIETKPYEIGDTSLWLYQDVLFHILAAQPWDRDNLVDLLVLQTDKNIWLYDVDQVNLNNATPLDYRGMLIENAPMYPYLVDNYRFKRCRFQRGRGAEIEAPTDDLYFGAVRTTMELI